MYYYLELNTAKNAHENWMSVYPEDPEQIE